MESQDLPPDTGAPSLRRVTASNKFLSSCIGACATSVIVNPLEVAKTRMQSYPADVPPTEAPPDLRCKHSFVPPTARHEHIAIGPGRSLAELRASEAVRHAPHPMHGAAARVPSTGAVLRDIVRNEGPGALWRGLSPSLGMAIPSTVIYFLGYEYLRTDVVPRQWGLAAPLLAGAMARTASATVTSPLELFRTRLQSAALASVSAAEGFRIVIGGVRDMYRAQGPVSLWRGLGPTLLRDVPFSAIYWLGLEESKRAFAMLRHGAESVEAFEGDAGFAVSFLAGLTSGCIAAFVTHPFDVVKTRLQTGMDTLPSGAPGRTLASLQRILHSQGVAGLFRGVVPRCGKVAPACAIMISSYEAGKRFLAQP